jgi:hypothetical protein
MGLARKLPKFPGLETYYHYSFWRNWKAAGDFDYALDHRTFQTCIRLAPGYPRASTHEIISLCFWKNIFYFLKDLFFSQTNVLHFCGKIFSFPKRSFIFLKRSLIFFQKRTLAISGYE